MNPKVRTKNFGVHFSFRFLENILSRKDVSYSSVWYKLNGNNKNSLPIGKNIYHIFGDAKDGYDCVIDDYSKANENAKLTFVPKTTSDDDFNAYINKKFSDDIWWLLCNNVLSIYGIPFKIVLIFDQFEEVINYPKSKIWTSRFFAWLEKISLDNCPQYILDEINKCVEAEDFEFPNIINKKGFKAIFSIRTEYIGELDYWCMQRYFIPELKHNRFCLKPLTMQGAEEVMRQYDGFDDGLRDNIKNVLLRSEDNKQRTISEGQNSEPYVSALILSVICTSLYHNKDLMQGEAFISYSIENFYNDIIGKCNISVEERNVIASVLVDKDKRVRVASDCSALEQIGFNKKYKNALLHNRLIKRNIVNGVEYIELVHDSLIDVVKKHKEEAIQKELRRKRRRNLAILSFLLSIVMLLVFLIIGLKKNEKNFLITQAKYIAAEAEKFAKSGDRYMCPDGKYIVTAFSNKVRIYTIKSTHEILDKWSEILGPNAELTKEEKAKYHFN